MLKDMNTPLKFITYLDSKKPFLDIQANNNNQAWDVYVEMTNAYIVGSYFPPRNAFKYKASGGQGIHIDLRKKVKPEELDNYVFLIA